MRTTSSKNKPKTGLKDRLEKRVKEAEREQERLDQTMLKDKVMKKAGVNPAMLAILKIMGRNKMNTDFKIILLFLGECVLLGMVISLLNK